MKKKVLSDSIQGDSEVITLRNLKNLIKNIAMCHSQEIGEKRKIVLTNKREFGVVKIAQSVMSLQEFKFFDQETMDKEIKTIEDSVKNIMESGILVKDQGIRKLVPLPYEVLILIFFSTNEKFRQYFFHELMDYYYHKFSENTNKLSEIKVLRKEDFDQQVKVLLPIVKFEVALHFMQNTDSRSQRILEEITSNIISFLKYPRINQEDIFVVVNNKLNSKNYELLSYELIPIDERNGHLGDYFKLEINIEFENTKKTLNLFAKFLTPKLEIMKELVKSGPSKKEEFFYMTYLPLLEEHGLQSLLDFSPRCYLSRLDDVLVLDDMVTMGFTALTPNIKLKFDGLMFAVKKIAKLHACSIILEERLSQQEGKTISLHDIYEDYLKEVLFLDTSNFLKESFQAGLNIVHYLAQRFSELNKYTITDDLKEKITTGWNLLFKTVRRSKKFKNTICHGDMYVSNMLFKFDTEGRCQDAILVDFQILRYCPPVHDLLFFIYQNSLKETRDKHYRQLVDAYYLELSKHFEDFNLDIAKIYSKEEFEESLAYMKPQAIFQALYYSPFNAIDPSLREQIFQDEELAKKYFSDDKTAFVDLGLENDTYRKVLGGLIQDMVELCESSDL